MTDLHATRITTADGQTVTVISRSPAITAWAQRYLGSWWSAAPIDVADVQGPVVAADVDPGEVTELSRLATVAPAKAEFAGDRLLYTTGKDGIVTAAQPDSGLAYRWDPAARRLTVAGVDETTVAAAAARLAREVMRGQLLAAGWQILHTSAVTRPDGATVLALGDKGAGKTTCGFLLARAGWQLLANDRVFVRAEGDTVRVLPWPSAAAIGFGLLDSLGLYDPVRRRVLAGEQLHPTQHQRVTDALVAGEREPLWKSSGKELKPQFFPDQLTTWLGMDLAVEGRAAALLFPQIQASADPELREESRGLQPGDFFNARTEDRYPDIFGLLPMAGPSTSLSDLVEGLPHQSFVLGHDTAAATVLVEDIANRLLLPRRP